MASDDSAKKSLSDLVAVMAALRDPETGCPWDIEQTFETIAPYTIEEAYEVADAITRADLVELEDELGDLLLQVVYHARIAEERGHFDLSDVIHAVASKMIRRHPHVFGTPEERAAGVTPGFWERIKAAERREKAERRQANGANGVVGERQAPLTHSSAIAGVPVALPALTRAHKLQAKAARVGFDWPTLDDVFAKMREELSELETVKAEESRSRQEEEFGDLLFVMANVARHMKIDPEAALRVANAKFTRRFEQIEAQLAADGRTPEQSTLAEMDALWDQAKAAEKGR